MSSKQMLKQLGIKNARLGKVKKVKNCCREIRIGLSYQEGKIYDSFNTNTNELEYWLCIKSHKNFYDSVMQRIHFEDE